MKCTNCGNEVSETNQFCVYCGTKVEKTEQPEQVTTTQMVAPSATTAGSSNTTTNNTTTNNTTTNNTTNNSSPKNKLYEPITPWGYIGYMLLFSIPVVGLVMLFIFAFGSDTNINLKNLAKAYLILMAIVLGIYAIMIIFMIIFVVGIGAAVGFSDLMIGLQFLL